MKMYIARTKGNVLTLHQSKPRRVKISHCSNEFFWASDVDTQSFLNKNLFPEVTFENSPQEVELKLLNNVQGK